LKWSGCWVTLSLTLARSVGKTLGGIEIKQGEGQGARRVRQGKARRKTEEDKEEGRQDRRGGR
jgi:hypothetical protein